MRKPALAAIATGALALAVAAPVSAATDEQAATITVVNALPESAIDVYNQDATIVDDLEAATIEGPMEITPGEVELTALVADSAGGDATTLGPALATIGDDEHLSVVTYLTEAGVPALTTFVDDVGPVQLADGGRLLARHVAAAPAVDILFSGEPQFTSLTNGVDAAVEVPAGDYSLTVAAEDSVDSLIDPLEVSIDPDTVTAVYVYGSLDDATLGVLTTTRAAEPATGNNAGPSATASASPSATPSASATASPSATAGGTTTDDSDDSSALWWWIIGAIIAAAIIAGIIAAAKGRAGSDPVSGDGRGPEHGPGGARSTDKP